MKPKRYLVFAGDFFYPSGGWNDFAGSYDTPEEAQKAASKAASNDGWSHVIDLETGKEMEELNVTI